MNFTIDVSVPTLTVFLQGLLSFFSPCVLPLVPLYIGYLAGGTVEQREDGTFAYNRRTVLLNTFLFVIGVSFAFFALGLGFSALGRFFSGNRRIFSVAGGVLIIFFGLHQMGLFRFRVVEQEKRLPLNLDKLAMGPLMAFLLGFTFSFAWTPCVGPALASVLMMASSVKSAVVGFGLIGVYTIGFILPFLAAGLFTSSLLQFMKAHQKIVRYTVQIGGALMVLMGLMMLSGWMNSFNSYLSGLGN